MLLRHHEREQTKSSFMSHRSRVQKLHVCDRFHERRPKSHYVCIGFVSLDQQDRNICKDFVGVALSNGTLPVASETWANNHATDVCCVSRLRTNHQSFILVSLNVELHILLPNFPAPDNVILIPSPTDLRQKLPFLIFSS